MYGFTLLLLYDFLILYIFFYADVINWSANSPLYEFLKNEIQKSFTLLALFIWFFVANIVAFFAFIKNLKEPYKIYFYNNKICSNKSIIEFSLKNIKHIYKSPYSVWGRKNENNFMFYIAFLIVISFLIIAIFLIFLARLCCKFFNYDYKLSLFYNIVIINDENQIINIQILSNKDYKLIKQYFEKNKI